MDMLVTFFVVLFVFAGVVILAGLASFCVVWVIFAIADRRRAKKIRTNWRY